MGEGKTALEGDQLIRLVLRPEVFVCLIMHDLNYSFKNTLKTYRDKYVWKYGDIFHPFDNSEDCQWVMIIRRKWTASHRQHHPESDEDN